MESIPKRPSRGSALSAHLVALPFLGTLNLLLSRGLPGDLRTGKDTSVMSRERVKCVLQTQLELHHG